MWAIQFEQSSRPWRPELAGNELEKGLELHPVAVDLGVEEDSDVGRRRLVEICFTATQDGGDSNLNADEMSYGATQKKRWGKCARRRRGCVSARNQSISSSPSPEREYSTVDLLLVYRGGLGRMATTERVAERSCANVVCWWGWMDGDVKWFPLRSCSRKK
jgi:hypothetical protein